ncbi:DUF881 domain-containing protein [Jidongwangia harbinensis]|uniref:DUF881 domain-containing protein n=1 Tax=Jidongwangia harbinensis TaxID=2878561 RepID=UPI001CD9E452|nr:DUF881 domain-containing protein [Jidongwangia harbinensis]MCA2214903.1 DUF881 domain-containing protein [Jidongwangia harbinensis]
MSAPDGPGQRRTFTADFLSELFRNPLDPGYADAAARKAREGEPTGVRRKLISSGTALTLVALGFLLVVAYRQTVADEPARDRAQRELVEQVQRRRADTVQLQARADRLRAEVTTLQEQRLSGAAVARLRNLEAATGVTPVRGPGAEVRLDDGPTPVDPVTGERKMAGRVKDIDLQYATNGLWAAGAEAIAVNGQRLTATSTIRQAGEAILVDFRPVTTPYKVVAIGPDSLVDDFSDGYAGRFLKQLSARYGISYDIREVDSVTLGAATELKLRQAKPSVSPYAPSSGVSGSASSAGPSSSAAPDATSDPASDPGSSEPQSTPSEGGR